MRFLPGAFREQAHPVTGLTQGEVGAAVPAQQIKELVNVAGVARLRLALVERDIGRPAQTALLGQFGEERSLFDRLLEGRGGDFDDMGAELGFQGG